MGRFIDKVLNTGERMIEEAKNLADVQVGDPSIPFNNSVEGSQKEVHDHREVTGAYITQSSIEDIAKNVHPENIQYFLDRCNGILKESELSDDALPGETLEGYVRREGIGSKVNLEKSIERRREYLAQTQAQKEKLEAALALIAKKA